MHPPVDWRVRALKAEADADRQRQADRERITAADAVRALLDALAHPDGRCVRKAWDDVVLLYGRFGSSAAS
jgi:hypothetical protein